LVSGSHEATGNSHTKWSLLSSPRSELVAGSRTPLEPSLLDLEAQMLCTQQGSRDHTSHEISPGTTHVEALASDH
jgi:hypothetical protein